MKRPLMCVLIFYILGILAGRYLNGHFSIILFLMSSLAINIWLFVKYRCMYVLIFMLFSFTGYIQIINSITPKDANLEQIVAQGIEVKLKGIVEDLNVANSGWQIVNFKAELYEHRDMFYKTNLKFRLLIKPEDKVYLGQSLVAEGILQKLDFGRNPGGYNEFQYLRSRKIEYKMFPEVLEFGNTNKSVTTILNELKNKIILVYEYVLPKEEASIIISMILGDKSTLPGEIKDLYITTGIYHILVVSGLHISIVAVFINSLLSKIFGKKTADVLTLILLILYCILTGNGISTVRALVMYSIIIVGKLIYRSRDLVTSVSFAALLLLLYEPMYLFDIGFQLSFIAVLSIGIGTHPVEMVFSKLVLKYPHLYLFKTPFLIKYLYPCLSVSIGIMPIILYHFYNISPLSPVTNLFIVPVAPVLVIFGFLTGIFGLISLETTKILASVCFLILKFYELVSNFFYCIPFSYILVGKLNLILILLLYLLIIVVGYTLIANSLKFNSWKKISFILVCLYVVLIVAFSIFDNKTKITMLDVGQGDSFVISKKGTVFIVDGGGHRNRAIGENTGVNVVIPYLKYRGISFVDGVFVTHSDYDHIAGIIEVVDNIKIGAIYLSDSLEEDNEFLNMLYLRALQYKIPIVILERGDKVMKGDMSFEALNSAYYDDDINESSLVLKLKYKEVSFLFTGDISERVESRLVSEGIDLQAEILNLAHHGSKFSSGREFVQRVNPKIAVVSAGRNNIYGHPSEEVVELLKELGIPLYSTTEHGAVTLITDGKDISISTMVGDK